MVTQCSVDEERVGNVKVGVGYISLSCEAVNDTYDISLMKAASNYHDYFIDSKEIRLPRSILRTSPYFRFLSCSRSLTCHRETCFRKYTYIIH